MRYLSEEIKTILNDSKFKTLYSLGLIDEIGFRNLVIKSEYQNLRKNNSIFDSIDILSSKFNLSESAINSILFRRRKLKTTNILSNYN